MFVINLNNGLSPTKKEVEKRIQREIEHLKRMETIGRIREIYYHVTKLLGPEEVEAILSESKVIRIYVDEDTKKQVQEQASKMQLSESAWARLAILRALDEYRQRREKEGESK